MKRAGKKPKPQRVRITMAQYEKARQGITTDVVSKVYLLFMLAARDELALTDDQMCSLTERFNCYAGQTDEHVTSMEEIKELIEKNVGVQLRGWTE